MTKTRLMVVLSLLAIVIGICLNIYISVFQKPEDEIADMTNKTFRAEKIGLQFIVDSSTLIASDREKIIKRLKAIVEEMNGYYRDSRVYLTASVQHISFVPIGSKDVVLLLEDMHRSRGAFPNVFKTADEYGADFSVAIVDDIVANGKKICGRGYDVNQTVEEISAVDRSVTVMQLACGAHTLAHELGHLMGLNHGYKIDSCIPNVGHKSAITSYANGYAEGTCDGVEQSDEFGTIMVGGFIRSINGKNKNKLEIFSNPDIYNEACGKSTRCGDPRFGNAARALNEYASLFANHEEPDVHTLDYSDDALKGCMRNSYWGQEIDDLRQLECVDIGINELQGLEQLSQLEIIDLSNNQITSLAPLLKLNAKQLRRVVLTGNSGISCVDVQALQRSTPDIQIVGADHCHEKQL